MDEMLKHIGNKNFFSYDESKVIRRSEIIGRALKYLRNRLGFTQAYIANEVGIAQQTYAGYESGKHEPGVEIMIRLADLYNVSMDYITGRYYGTDPMEHAIEEQDVEIILRETIEHYELQAESDKNFMRLINDRIKNNRDKDGP